MAVYRVVPQCELGNRYKMLGDKLRSHYTDQVDGNLTFVLKGNPPVMSMARGCENAQGATDVIGKAECFVYCLLMFHYKQNDVDVGINCAFEYLRFEDMDRFLSPDVKRLFEMKQCEVNTAGNHSSTPHWQGKPGNYPHMMTYPCTCVTLPWPLSSAANAPETDLPFY